MYHYEKRGVLLLVNLDSLRPKNETYEHFLLKQVARAWLFKKGVRVIGCEVNVQGDDISPYGKKSIVDVVGIERKRKQDPKRQNLYGQIYNRAAEIGLERGILQPSRWGGRPSFNSHFHLKGEEKVQMELAIDSCFEDACEEMGLGRKDYIPLQNPYVETWVLNQIECKASLSDYKNGYSLTSEVSYLIAPKGVIPSEELPKKVGLLEFDFDLFHATKDWEKALTIKKKSRKTYDSSFLFDPEDPKSIDKVKHENYCRGLLFDIGQEATEEAVFWNPFLRHVPDGGAIGSKGEWYFSYKVGDQTPLGIIIDRKIGPLPKEDKALVGHGYHLSNTAFYKMVVPNEGITKWISQPKVAQSFVNLKRI